ncbi:MAG: hypothetical protein QXV81_08070, partial [Ignisphaera sp.]
NPNAIDRESLKRINTIGIEPLTSTVGRSDMRKTIMNPTISLDITTSTNYGQSSIFTALLHLNSKD